MFIGHHHLITHKKVECNLPYDSVAGDARSGLSGPATGSFTARRKIIVVVEETSSCPKTARRVPMWKVAPMPYCSQPGRGSREK